MDMVMVALQHIKSPRKPFVSCPENREIMQVFDLMMDVELIEHELKPRHELARKLLRRKLVGTEKRGDLLDCGRQLAKHRMAGQPQTRQFTEVGMTVPPFARIARQKDAQVLGPAAAAGKSKGAQIRGIGDFDAHSRLDSRSAANCEGQTWLP